MKLSDAKKLIVVKPEQMEALRFIGKWLDDQIERIRSEKNHTT